MNKKMEKAIAAAAKRISVMTAEEFEQELAKCKDSDEYGLKGSGMFDIDATKLDLSWEEATVLDDLLKKERYQLTGKQIDKIMLIRELEKKLEPIVKFLSDKRVSK
jgi:hypothetical protein